MRKLRDVLSVGTMLPALLLSTPGFTAPLPTEAPAASPQRLAQIVPFGGEEQLRRDRPPASGSAAPARPAAPPPSVAPSAAPAVAAPPVQPPAAREAPVQAAPAREPAREPARTMPRVEEAVPRSGAPKSAEPTAPQPVREPRVERPARSEAPPPAAPAVPHAPRVDVPPAPRPVVAPPSAETAKPAAPGEAPRPRPPVVDPSRPAAPQGAADPAPRRPDVGAPERMPPRDHAAPPVERPGREVGPQDRPDVRPRPPMPERAPERAPEGDHRSGITPLGAAAVGAAVGVVGGMILGGQPAQGLGEVQSHRRERRDGDATVYSEPGRVIVRDADGLRLRHDETERFRELGGDVRTERRGDETVQIYERPDGVRIVTVTDADGRLLRRIRRAPDGRDVVLIDNGPARRPGRWSEERIVVEPARPTMARDRYEVDAGRADESLLYDTLEAPPVAPLQRRYTLDEVRYNRDLRGYMRSVDVDTLTFETGSWTVDPTQYDRLAVLADAINRALARNPDEIFLVEGHTDAVGADIDNLSLSDRRAQSVAAILTRSFRVPAENLTTQGYGEQFLKVQTEGPSRENRRVTLRRITPLISGDNRR